MPKPKPTPTLWSKSAAEDKKAALEKAEILRILESQGQTLLVHRGRSIDMAAIESATRRLARAPKYAEPQNQMVPFVYEVLDPEAIIDGEKVKETAARLVELWQQNPDNIRRAAAAVGRAPPEPGSDVIAAFSTFRFRERKNLDRAKVLELAVESKEKGERSTIVILALDDLSFDNGSFVPLAAGEDVCFDGHSPLYIPPTGGGLCIYIDLNI